jgi:pimeloyl-ACP methyl ester carboxylesterase
MNTTNYKAHSIAYTQEGKGIPIVLLHGFCEDSRMWEDFLPDLLEEGFQVIRVDLPGFGQSAVIPKVSIEGMAHAVLAVLEELQVGPVVMIGHSMGGYVGLAFARLFPQLLSGLGLFHSHPYADTPEKRAERQKSVDFIKRQGHVLFVKQMIPNLFAPNFARSNAFLLEKMAYRASHYQSEGIIAAQQAMAQRPEETATLKALEAPVLFIIGKEDQTVPADQNTAQTVLPTTASIHILPRAAHMGMFEARKDTQLMVRQFADFCSSQAADKNRSA